MNIKAIFDSLLSYETFKVVKVQDKRLGFMYRFFQLAIAAYIIYTIIANQRYLNKQPPVPGAIRISLQAPPTFNTDLPYCNNPLPCVFWGANEIQFPNDGAGVAFFTTRASATRYPPPPGNCSYLSATSPSDPCFFNVTSANSTSIIGKSYIGDIEDYTIMIEHSIRGQVGSVTTRNGLMDGTLYNSKQQIVRKLTNATRMQENPRADGDIISVSELLSAAGADLEAPSTAPGANKGNSTNPGETYRSSGIVIVIVINYENIPFTNTIQYSYYPQTIDGNEYKTEDSTFESDGSYLLKDRHGIRLVFQQYGEIGQFDFISLLVSFVAGFALFSVATITVELLMLKVLPEKDDYERVKFETTHDFDERRKQEKQREEAYSF